MIVKRVYSVVLIVLCFTFISFQGKCFGDTVAMLEQAQQYKEIITANPNSEEAFTAQEGLAVIYVKMGKQTEADTAYQELLAKYSNRKDIANAIDHVSDAYRR